MYSSCSALRIVPFPSTTSIVPSAWTLRTWSLWEMPSTALTSVSLVFKPFSYRNWHRWQPLHQCMYPLFQRRIPHPHSNCCSKWASNCPFCRPLKLVTRILQLMRHPTEAQGPVSTLLHFNIHLTALLCTQATDKYRCVQCNRRFVSSYNLNRHLKVHAGVKPFRCPEAVCGKEFTYEDHLKRHAITHSADSRTMVCSICKMSFNRKFNFSRHLTKVHKISDSLHSNRLK